MPISVICSSCGQKLKAKDSLAGRTLPCPKCKSPIAIAALAEEDVAALLLAEDSSPPPSRPETSTTTPRKAPFIPPDDLPPVRPIKRPDPVIKPISMNEPPPWLRHLHWGLVAALLPLAFVLLFGADRTFSDGDFPRLMPDGRFEGALLARNSWVHWVFAALSATGFLIFLALLASYQSDGALRVIWLAGFTATIGVFFLLLLQQLAAWSAHIMPRGGLIAIPIIIIKIIGFSYDAALNPENGFLLSFFGFTVGVGFCEEVCKSIPVFLRIRSNPDIGWRDAFLSGLASGAGFGISEGIIYSSNYYNGIAGGDMYVVRFVSCVALHALWTGSVAITIQQNQHLFYDKESWYEFLPPLVRVVGVPMVLHGLYDTCLKKDMTSFALGAAVLGFLFLAYQISQLHSVDDEAARKAMLKEYKKRKKMMT